MENNELASQENENAVNPFAVPAAQNVNEGQGPKITLGDVLLEYVQALRVFMSQSGEAYASVSVNSGTKNIKIESKEFKECLLLHVYNRFKMIPKKRDVSEAMDLALSLAGVSGIKVELQNRLAFDGTTMTWDLGREDGSFVIINKDGWYIDRITDHPFLRLPHHSSVPLPNKSGNILELTKFLNIADDLDMVLVVVWAVAAFINTIPRPILCLHGSQGSAKTTLARMLKSLIDPTEQGGIYVRNKDEELAQIMAKSAVPFFDNLTKITKSVENLLCMGVTGGGFEKRKLYTDSESIIFKFKRPILITGINVPFDAQDLIDRTISIELSRIDEAARLYESEINDEFESAKPTIIGGILDTLAGAMRKIDGVTLTHRPRMADFARWGSAIADEIGVENGFGAERFQLALSRALEEGYRASVAGDRLIQTTLAFLTALEADGMAPVTGLVSQCHQALVEYALRTENVADHIPSTPQLFSQALKKYVPVLEVNGWKTTFSANRKHGRQLSFEKMNRFNL